MKRLSWVVAALITALASFYLVQAANELIRWTLAGKPIVEITVNGEPKVQFGLRQDGVVVWREIMNTTNSPAEKPFQFDQQWFLTNGTFTNAIIFDKVLMTNNVP